MFFLLSGKDPRALQQCEPAKAGVKLSPAFNSLIQECTAYEEDERTQSVVLVLNRLEELGGAERAENGILAMLVDGDDTTRNGD